MKDMDISYCESLFICMYTLLFCFNSVSISFGYNETHATILVKKNESKYFFIIYFF